jgi:mRNA interferase MazF
LSRGEIRWYTFRPPDKRRPVLILTRSDVIDQLNEIIVARATRNIRGLTTEVVLSPEDGMPVLCALNLDHVSLAQRDRIGAALCIETGPKFAARCWSRVALKRRRACAAFPAIAWRFLKTS